MQVELNEIDKEIKDEVELIMAKYDMAENDFVCFLFEKCFVVQDSELAGKVADIIVAGKMPEV